MSKARKRIKSAEKDVELLLSRFTKAVQQGAELSFATFKRVWVDLHFSYVFLVSCVLLRTASKHAACCL